MTEVVSTYYSKSCVQDEDAMDKDGNDLEGEGSRPQKHAKSPELARDFLLDAATVIFKEQVITHQSSDPTVCTSSVLADKMAYVKVLFRTCDWD